MAFQRINKIKRASILAALCESMAINSVCRIFKTGKPNVLRFIREVGFACEDYHNRHVRDLTIARLELDEQWAYVHTHRERMNKAQKDENPGRGDCWLWASIDPVSKVIVNWRTGKRTSACAHSFARDLAARVNGRVQITTDPLKGYKFAVPSAFGDRVDLATEGKIFQSSKCPAHEWPRYRVDPLVGVQREVVCGTPDLSTATVCHIERYFLTVRQGNKRCARKTMAYSKLWDNHALTGSLHIFVYNFVRKHEGLDGKTPAVVLGVESKRWTLEDVVEMTDDYLRKQDELRFEIAFESQFSEKPRASRTYAPVTPKVPWYLDPESGGPNPIVKKPGIAYDETQPADE